MTKFEEMLIDKGYIKHVLEVKTMTYNTTSHHHISTMVNLDHRYFHKTDENILSKITSKTPVTDIDFTWEDRKGEICFGLNEVGKPPTLISPRPRIDVIRIKYGERVLENELHDDSMNEVLRRFSSEEIFEAMFDKSITLKIDLTKKN